MQHWLLIAPAVVLIVTAGRTVFQSARSGPARWAFSTIVAMLWLALVSYVLMRFEAYSLWGVAGANLLASGGLWASRERFVSVPSKPADEVLAATDAAVAAVAVLAFAIYEAYPTTYMLGGRDPGIYLIFGRHIAETGGLQMDQPWVRELHERVPNVVRLGYPAIYSLFERGLSDDPAAMSRQFMHLAPSFAANGHAAFGLEGGARANAVLSALSVFAVYDAGRRMVGPVAAAVVATLLAMNPAVIWVARNTVSEPMALLMSFVGLALLYSARERSSARLGGLAGLVLGLSMLARIDACLNVLIVAGFAATVPADRDARHPARAAALGFLVGFLVSVGEGWIHSGPYIRDLWDARLERMLPGTVLAALVAVGLTVVPDQWYPSSERCERFSRSVAMLAAVLLSIWLGYDYVVRAADTDNFWARSIVELGWYTTPVVFPLAASGALLVGRADNWQRWVPFLALGALSIFVFTWKPFISEDHIWASRRWVPQTIPALLLLAALPFTLLARLGGVARIAGLGLAVIASAGYAVNAWQVAEPFRTERMMGGIEDDYAELVRVIEQARAPGTVVLSDSEQVASVLTYYWGVPTVRVERAYKWTDAEVEALAGHVLLVREPISARGEPLRRVRIGGMFMERTRGQLPTRIGNWRHTIQVVRLPDDPTAIPEWVWAGDGLDAPKSQIRDPRRGALVANGEEGLLSYGPYTTLGPGTYRVRWTGWVADGGEVSQSVTSGRGEQRHIRQTTRATPGRGEIAELVFGLPAQRDEVEFQFWVTEGVRMGIRYVHLARLGDFAPPTEPVLLQSYRPKELERRGSELLPTGVSRSLHPGLVQYGPYRKLLLGDYRVSWHGVVGGEGEVKVDVTSDSGRKTHGRVGPVVRADSGGEVVELGRVDLRLDEDEEQVEFRLFMGEGLELELHEVRLHRLEYATAPPP